MSAVHKRGGKRAQARKADKVFSERREASCRVDRIRRENRVRRNSLQHTVAGNHCAIGFTNKRTRTRRMARSVDDAQRAIVKFQLLLISQLAVFVLLKR